MATIKEIQLKNTMLFLENFTNETVELTKQEILKKRNRSYRSGNINSAINASGSGLASIKKEKKADGFNIVGNSYLEDVDEGTNSTKASLSDILAWVKRKPVKPKNSRGSFEKVTAARQKSIAKLIQKSLVLNGIKRTAFLTDLMDRSYGRLEGIGDSVADDVVDSIEDILESGGFIKKGGKYTLDTKR